MRSTNAAGAAPDFPGAGVPAAAGAAEFSGPSIGMLLRASRCIDGARIALARAAAAAAAATCEPEGNISSASPVRRLAAGAPNAARLRSRPAEDTFGIAAAPPGATASGGILRISCLAISSPSPPGLPVKPCANWVSSMLWNVSLPVPSSIPLLGTASRMLFITICMNRASNCEAAWRIDAFGSRAAPVFSASSERASDASEPDTFAVI